MLRWRGLIVSDAMATTLVDYKQARGFFALFASLADAKVALDIRVNSNDYGIVNRNIEEKVLKGVA